MEDLDKSEKKLSADIQTQKSIMEEKHNSAIQAIQTSEDKMAKQDQSLKTLIGETEAKLKTQTQKQQDDHEISISQLTELQKTLEKGQQDSSAKIDEAIKQAVKKHEESLTIIEQVQKDATTHTKDVEEQVHKEEQATK